MALDIGEKRVGVAISDPDERVASPVCVLAAEEVRSNGRSFRIVLEDWEPELLLCGLPMTLAGEEGLSLFRDQISAFARRTFLLRVSPPFFKGLTAAPFGSTKHIENIAIVIARKFFQHVSVQCVDASR